MQVMTRYDHILHSLKRYGQIWHVFTRYDKYLQSLAQKCLSYPKLGSIFVIICLFIGKLYKLMARYDQILQVMSKFVKSMQSYSQILAIYVKLHYAKLQMLHAICQGDICLGNICPGNICIQQQYFSGYWCDFDQTLKVGFSDHL